MMFKEFYVNYVDILMTNLMRGGLTKNCLKIEKDDVLM